MNAYQKASTFLFRLVGLVLFVVGAAGLIYLGALHVLGMAPRHPV